MLLKRFLLMMCVGVVWGQFTTYNVATCDGSAQRLSCGTGVIKIRSANYGRTNGYTCSAGVPAEQRTNVWCNQPEAYSILSQRCDGSQYCELNVGPEQFPDPCANTFKYLNTSYSCLHADTSVTCEHEVGELNCGAGVIKVFRATYGRRDGTTCTSGRPPRQLVNVNCFQSRTLQISNSCNGKNSCSLTTSHPSFSDPCYGTYKYLEVTYGCYPAKTSVTCENSAGELQCGSNLIQVFYTNYGRRDNKTCAKGRPSSELADIDCFQSRTLQISARCNGNNTCLVSATDPSFPDPCSGIYKYLEVTYGCYPAKTSVTCEGHQSFLDCGNDAIRIYKANYGRRKRDICSHLRPWFKLKNVNCLLPETLHLMSNRCNGKSQCEVKVDNGVFTDPCAGTYKYLEVSYGCLPFILGGCIGAAVCGKFNNSWSGIVTTCDGSVQQLSCEEGIIKIESANYGRTNGITCSQGVPTQQLTNVQCNQPGVYCLVSQRCDGTKKCEVSVGPTEFSDPCADTFKYLETSYSCIPANTSVTCEYGVGTLNCGADFIKIFHTTYGRRDSTTCSAGRPPTQLANVNCFLCRTLQISNSCDGKNLCSVIATDQSFPDPCFGTYKYLEVSYGCYSAKTSITCDGATGELSCGKDFIKVLHATYGRRDKTTCSNGRPPTEVAVANCYQPRTLQISSRCDGKNRCFATFPDPSFSDPCVGTYKYLEVTYRCYPAQINVACEGFLSSLDCGNNVIRILEANYGRRSRTICTTGRPQSQLENVNCLLPETFRVMSDRCDGKSRCEMLAENSIFTDPCYGTYKYLEVSYSCFPPRIA
ncbi:uncharacterized protein LOC108920449 [Scleropages formosus]|uniref:uncharacterized protein LOC108920449 n=1 Tax=Scleropages formosus TaxID=113540 RepID=UPI0010FA916B|nr:uncharacterized protein LOC108920449 [Scleropages formosus]